MLKLTIIYYCRACLCNINRVRHIKSSPLPQNFCNFLSNKLEFQCKILHTYLVIICIYISINRSYLSTTVLKLSVLQHCHLAILVHSETLLCSGKFHYVSTPLQHPSCTKFVWISLFIKYEKQIKMSTATVRINPDIHSCGTHSADLA